MICISDYLTPWTYTGDGITANSYAAKSFFSLSLLYTFPPSEWMLSGIPAQVHHRLPGLAHYQCMLPLGNLPKRLGPQTRLPNHIMTESMFLCGEYRGWHALTTCLMHLLMYISWILKVAGIGCWSPRIMVYQKSRGKMVFQRTPTLLLIGLGVLLTCVVCGCVNLVAIVHNTQNGAWFKTKWQIGSKM